MQLVAGTCPSIGGVCGGRRVAKFDRRRYKQAEQKQKQKVYILLYTELLTELLTNY